MKALAKKYNSDYWEQRIANNTWEIYNSGEQKNIKLLEMYRKASKDIEDAIMRLAIRQKATDGVLKNTDIYKQNHLVKLQREYLQILHQLGDDIEGFARQEMLTAYQDNYSNAMNVLGGVDFSIPNKKLFEKIIEEPWRGSSFSERLWRNQSKLGKVLNDIMTQGLTQGKTVTEMAINVSNAMQSGFNEAHRLVRTETMHYLNDSSLKAYKNLRIENIQYWAAEDERTCKYCGKMHGKTYEINKAPILPLHPNCRCTYLPVINKDDELIAIDGKGLVNSDEHDIIKMYRKGGTHRKIAASGEKIIDKATYHKITNPAIKNGADIRIADEELTRHLIKEDATAVTIGDVIIFRKDATVSDVLEEVHHFWQNKKGLNIHRGNRQRIILNEIEAKEYVLSVADKYHIPSEEIELTKNQLESYRKEMQRLKERRMWDD